MFIWNLHGMRKRLRSGPLPQSEQFQYLISGTLFSWANGQSPFWGPPHWNLLIGAIQLVIVGFAIYYTYIANGGRSGERFLERYICLCWILLVRYFVLVQLPLFFLWDVYTNSQLTRFAISPFFSMGVFFAVQLTFYWVLAQQLRAVSRSAT